MDMTITTFFSRIASIRHKEGGVALLEALLGLALLVIISVSYVGALSTSSIAARNADKRVTAEIVARSQLEYTKSLPFHTAPYTYPSINGLPAGHSVTSEATPVQERDDNIQRITVTVHLNGENIVTIEDFKLNR
jgi:Tfp pilus assembly protein PilV